MELLTTGQKLKKLRTAEGITQQSLASDFNIKQDDISRFENDKQELSLYNLKKYCERYNVSADYLLGLSDYPTSDKDERYISDVTGLEKDAISFIGGAVSKWKEAIPSRDTLQIYNQFISTGMLSLLVEAMTDYYEELNSVINHIKSAVCTLTDEYNEKDDTQLCDTFQLSDFDRELRFFTLEMQEIVNGFMRRYAEQEFLDYNKAIEELNKANRKNLEHNSKVKAKMTKAGGQDGDDLQAQ